MDNKQVKRTLARVSRKLTHIAEIVEQIDKRLEPRKIWNLYKGYDYEGSYVERSYDSKEKAEKALTRRLSRLIQVPNFESEYEFDRAHNKTITFMTMVTSDQANQREGVEYYFHSGPNYRIAEETVY